MASKYCFVVELLRFALFFSPLPFSTRLNSAAGFPVRVLIAHCLHVQTPRNLDAVGWGVAWVALWRAFPQTQILVF
jgi:hypothetical protein